MKSYYTYATYFGIKINVYKKRSLINVLNWVLEQRVRRSTCTYAWWLPSSRWYSKTRWPSGWPCHQPCSPRLACSHLLWTAVPPPLWNYVLRRQRERGGGQGQREESVWERGEGREGERVWGREREGEGGLKTRKMRQRESRGINDRVRETTSNSPRYMHGTTKTSLSNENSE